MLNWDNPDSIEIPDLIEIINWIGSGDSEMEDVAKKAGEIMFYKFGPSLLVYCEQLCIKHNRDLADSIKIAQRAIRKFIHNKTFSFEKARIKDNEKAVKAFLNKIAFHESVNLYREELKIADKVFYFTEPKLGI